MWRPSWLGGTKEKGVLTRIELEEGEFIELVGEDAKVFSALWTEAQQEKSALLDEVAVENDVLAELQRIRVDIVKLEELAPRLKEDNEQILKLVNEYNKAKNKHILGHVRDHEMRERRVSREEFVEGERLAIDAEKRLRALQTYAKRIMKDERLSVTTRQQINKLVRGFRRRMKKILNVLVSVKELGIIDEKETAAAPAAA